MSLFAKTSLMPPGYKIGTLLQLLGIFTSLEEIKQTNYLIVFKTDTD